MSDEGGGGVVGGVSRTVGANVNVQGAQNGFGMGSFFGGGALGGALGGLTPLGNEWGGTVGSVWENITAPFKNHAGPDAPNVPPPPTLGQANMTSLAGQMDQERRMRYSNPNLTGGQGLLDQPTTASHALLGS